MAKQGGDKIYLSLTVDLTNFTPKALKEIKRGINECLKEGKKKKINKEGKKNNGD